MSSDRPTGIRVGLTEKHGMTAEFSKYPPPGVQYSFIKPLSGSYSFIRSPIKGYLRRYAADDNDIIEAILSPVLTKSRWVYYLANLQEATAFGFLGLPTPRAIRVAYLKSLILKSNFKKLIFWSEAGKGTLRTYGKVRAKAVIEKSAVVYPAIRKVDERLIKFSGGEVNILFSGDFFRKGGINVIDAFERAHRTYPNAKLILCCDKNIDFNTPNIQLRSESLQRIADNKSIEWLGRIPRDELVNTILPKTDIYLLPTYVEAFGFAILEAMAFGIPVISTNYFAIPEMIEHNASGFLIDTSNYNCDRLFKGYVVDRVPEKFRKHITDSLFDYLCRLIESPDLREKLGRAGLDTARTKFSFEERNRKMYKIYREALSNE